MTKPPFGAWLCAFAISVVWIAEAGAQEDRGAPLTCSFTYERATAIGHAAASTDPMNVFTDYGSAEAAKLLAAINTLPPVTAYPAEHILVIERTDDDFVMIALAGMMAAREIGFG